LSDVKPAPRDLLATLHHPATIRQRCAALTQALADGRSGHFKLDRSRLDDAAQQVVACLKRDFPDGVIPLHSRWRQFQAGGIDRIAELDTLLAGRTPAEQARARIDLTVVSVLLDAEAGVAWRYRERPGVVEALALPGQQHGADQLLALLDQAAAGASPAVVAEAPAPVVAAPAAEQPGPTFTRAEGLAVASLRAFVGGAFSAVPSDPLRADAAALKLVDSAALRLLMQSSAGNPLPALEGRAGLLSRLGATLTSEAARDGLPARPGLLYDRLCLGEEGTRSELPAAELLQWLMKLLAPVWQSGNVVKGVPSGDAWPHHFAGATGGDPATAGWVPVHQLGQWLAWSLIEPLRLAGVQVTGIDALTGLPGLDVGGLLIDIGVIVPRHERDLSRRWKAGDEWLIEWRALTVTLQDELAQRVRAQTGLSAAKLPLAAVLTGAVAAGRALAAERRRGGAPAVQMDGESALF
jgi:Protein of unknown function (DUF1688)